MKKTPMPNKDTGRTKMLTASRIVLGAALAAIPAVAQTTVEVSDFLPLSVGNSWTYVFIYDDPRRHPDQFHGEEITISILRTEMIDGNAYYEFSDIPEGFAVAPAHSIAGKKLRWKGSHLMEHDGVSEYAVYRFQEIPAHGHSEGRYDLEPSDAHGDTVATTRTYINGSGVAEAWFRFSGSTTEPYTSGYPARGLPSSSGMEWWSATTWSTSLLITSPMSMSGSTRSEPEY